MIMQPTKRRKMTFQEEGSKKKQGLGACPQGKLRSYINDTVKIHIFNSYKKYKMGIIVPRI